MDTSDWMSVVIENKDDLRDLIENYHPFYESKSNHKITAPAAEEACKVIRKDISKKTVVDPVLEWDSELPKNNISKLYKLLNDAWVGVPETRSCWKIRGFKVACSLLEDPPEE